LDRALYLFDQLLIHSNISMRTIQRLLQEGKQDRDNDHSFQGLTEDDEEDGNGEYVDRHDGWS